MSTYNSGYYDYSSSSGGSSSYKSSIYSPPSSAGSDSPRNSETNTRSRLNHKNQIVSVINHGQKSSDAYEPRPEYRDASCYYGRSS